MREEIQRIRLVDKFLGIVFQLLPSVIRQPEREAVLPLLDIRDKTVLVNQRPIINWMGAIRRSPQERGIQVISLSAEPKGAVIVECQHSIPILKANKALGMNFAAVLPEFVGSKWDLANKCSIKGTGQLDLQCLLLFIL